MTKNYFFSRRFIGAVALCLGGVLSVSAVEPISVASASPANGSVVNRLKQISLELNNAHPEYGTEWKSGLRAPVKDADGNEVTYVTGLDTGLSFRLNLAKELTEAGTYTIDVPAGALYTMDWEIYEPVVESYNEAFSLKYTVEEMAQVVIVGTEPASGSTMSRLKQVQVTLSGGDELYGIEWAYGVKAEIRNGNGEVMSEYATIRNVWGSYWLNINSEITTPGTYTITIPDGALYAINEDYEHVYGTENSETELTYNVVESPAIEFDSAVPASGDTVSRLSEIVTYWNNVSAEPGFDIAGNTVNVTDASGDVVAVASVSRNFATCVLTLDTPVTVDGKYTVEIPEDTFFAVDNAGNRVVDNGNPEVTLLYTVDSTVGVNTLNNAARGVKVVDGRVVATGFSNATVEVYTPAGSRVAATALAPGLYIIKAADAAGTLVERVLVK